MLKCLLIKTESQSGMSFCNRINLELFVIVKWVLVYYARMKPRLTCLITQRKVVFGTWSFRLLCSMP